ncbi:hypothetical protein AB433_05825 [Croceicoccus naphthovorans]|uniref:SGNH hydrolase-type esterase domain-containing protein n=1 Tax=Croceicoccus naphthovorans TaxID=1348774 RepID=A0A0G3XDK3_9SPHN|nr:hypothetical protein AB433_05825 [Croceicoccus naphthovorans]
MQFDPVTVQISAGFASAFADGVVIPSDDSRVIVLGGRTATPVDSWAQGYLFPQAKTLYAPMFDANGFSNQRRGSLTGIDFVLPGGQSEFEVVTRDSGLASGVFLSVDGAETSTSALDFLAQQTGKRRYTRVVMPPSAQDRRITLRGSAMIYSGLRLPSGEALGSPPAFEGPTAVFIGDSVTEGTGAGHVTRSWGAWMASMLGWHDPILAAVGGTGYLQRLDEKLNFADRPEDVLEAVNGGPPDVAVIAGGINDCGRHEPAALEEAARHYFEVLRDGAPDMVIFVFGPFSSYYGYGEDLTACRDAIFSAANSVSGTYTVDVTGWVTPETRDVIFDGTNNGPHPIPAGHRLYGEYGATKLRQIIQAF